MKDKFKIGDRVTITIADEEYKSMICTITELTHPKQAKHSVWYYVTSTNKLLENVLMFEEELEFVNITLQEYVERSVERYEQ